MPRQKDLKRLVRARMKKTGESYTASRTKILARDSIDPTQTARSGRSRASRPAVARPDYAALAGFADTAVKAKTGCTWDRWVAALDYHGAARMSHGEIAALVSTKYKIDGWWAQAVTVGYERIKGLRARGQRRDGTYEVNRSRTYPVPVQVLFDAWADRRLRRRWLDAAVGEVRTATPHKALRLDGPDRTIVVVWFEAKGPSKSIAGVQHTKLRDAVTADRLKQYWAEQLDALGRMLASATLPRANSA